MTSKNNDKADLRAVIYCRVSSTRQKTEGGGLDSQEHRCRQYAAAQGYDVEAVFPDDASGGGDFIKRPGMVALLSFLDAQPDKKYVVIFDDLKRFARDTEFHFKLRHAFAERGATVECLNFNFEDTPEGKFIETIVAAHGELEREQNRRQVRQKMVARIEKGYWVFHAPVGYRYASDRTHGKLLVRDEPLASIVQEALEVFFDVRKIPGLKKKPSTSELIDWLKLLMADDIPDEILTNRDASKAIPPLYGALVKNEQDVHLLERLAFMNRRDSRG